MQETRPSQPPKGDAAIIEAECKKCRKVSRIQANFEKNFPLSKGCVAFPASNRLKCSCGNEIDLSAIRKELEDRSSKKIVTA